MYIEYHYRPADAPNVNYFSGLTISNIKSLIVSDLVKIISEQSPTEDLSDLCSDVIYYGDNSGWLINTLDSDDDFNMSIKSSSESIPLQKYITLSTYSDNTDDFSGFIPTTDPFTGVVEYSNESSASLTLSILVYDFNTITNQYRIIPESKLSKLYYFAQGGTIRISLSQKHFMICSNSEDNSKYQPPLSIFDINSTDIVLNNTFSDFVYFNSNTFASSASAYSTIKSNSSIYVSDDYNPPKYSPNSKVLDAELNLLTLFEAYKTVGLSDFPNMYDDDFYNTGYTIISNYVNSSPIDRYNSLMNPSKTSLGYQLYIFRTPYSKMATHLLTNGGVGYYRSANFEKLINAFNIIFSSSNYTLNTIPKITNNYNIEVYDKDGVINFYKDGTSKYQYANHLYVNYKVDTDYHFGGNISKDTQVYMLPKNSLGKTFDEISYDTKTYVVWSTYNNDYSIKYPRFLIYKG
jgi:hypothetical protein